jgi:hypothetical protein
MSNPQPPRPPLNLEASESEWVKAGTKEFLKIPLPDSREIGRKLLLAYQKTCRLLSGNFILKFIPIHRVLAVIPVPPEGSPEASWIEMMEMSEVELKLEQRELAQKYTIGPPREIRRAILLRVAGTTEMGNPDLYTRLVNLKDRVEFGDLYQKALSLERRCTSLYNQVKARVRNRWRDSRLLIGEGDPEDLNFQYAQVACGLQELEREPPKKPLH